ncbi:GreA/GreB family elongation factor [Lacimicrobium alkaliphilum]|uniref:Transcription elongation factor GreAB n=1 Tax=Lacimicrobium alkaliphilum TaxID=1526571 RepID=A0A0U2ZMK1_9ALTE|nr:GreA/GreB family elongation factor [Lacimicrobium alkaliphilum]ALS99532.1 transcription elongation factor GreAB [Lacimicrobium alkaliphilum]
MSIKPNIIISTVDLAIIENSIEDSRLPKDFQDALETELARANIVAPNALPADVISLGRRVTFKITETGQILTRKLISPKQRNNEDDCLSVFAPLGAALIGMAVGQTIQWATHRGLETIEVISIA